MGKVLYKSEKRIQVGKSGYDIFLRYESSRTICI